MKRLNLILLMLGATMIFIGCQKDKLTDTEQLKQQEVYLKAEPVEFAGVSTPVATINPGIVTVLPNGMVRISGMIAEWYENPDPDDPYYTGQSIWYETWLIDPDGKTAKVWGKTDLNLDGDIGTWKMSWHGYIYAYEGYDLRDGLVPCTAEALVLGQGKSGVVKGMVSRANYEMDFNGDLSTFFWSFSGTYH
ncbi:MAG: hypothetical protein ABFS05_04740 [Bacteroidota bacterium]